MLENIRSQYNVGSIFRSADAFGVEKIFCVGYTPDPDAESLKKTSLGAERTVAWSVCVTIREAIEECKREGCIIVALETGPDALDIRNVRVKYPVALILGNEVTGLSGEALRLADQKVMIPMCGHKESLNVSVTAAVALFALTANKT